MNDKANELCLTMKGIALMKLVEAGVIQREEDGNVNTDGFERNLYTAMDNAMEELSRSYQSGEKTAGKADQGADHGAGERKLHGKKLILPALALVLGFFLALLLVGR